MKKIIFSSMFFIFAIMFLVIFIISINYYNNSNVSYEDLEYREFTIAKMEKIDDPEMGISYTISVCETDKKIKINNLLTNAEVVNGVEALKTGDKIYCYLFEAPSNYNVVEIKAEKTILSLEQYNKTYSNQGILGIIIMPIGFVICLTFSIVCLFAKFKEKENIANEE